jgi:hypothetical protein
MENLRLTTILAQIEPEPIAAAHLKAVAELHFRQLSWSFSGQFGERHILELYEALYKSKHFFGYVYYNKGELIGFVTATTDYADTRRFVIDVFAKKILQTVGVFLRHPRFFLTALESRFIVPRVFSAFGTKAEWLTFVTDTSKAFLSPFVALKLIDALNEHFKAAGIPLYMAQGFKNNPKAIRYYEKLKWRVARPLLMHNVYAYVTTNQGE